MNVYLTSTPEFPDILLKEVVLILNQTGGELQFVYGKPLTGNQFSLRAPGFKGIKKTDKLPFKEFYDFCNTYRIIKEIEEDEFVVMVSTIKNEKDWFSAFNGKNIFIYGEEWEYYTKRDSKYGIASQVVENIFQSQLELNIEVVDDEPNIHIESIGCINDMCMNGTDILFKLRTADICESCLQRAEEKKVNPLIIEQISRVLRILREEFVNTNKIISKVKPENVYVNSKRDVRIGSKNVVLDPLNKVLFIFFLKNLDGVETKLISKYEGELYQIYKEIRDNPDQLSITRLVNSVKGANPTFETVKCRMNKSLVEQLGPKLAEYYLLDSVEIKDEYNRYKINLREEYITIDPPIRK